MNMPWINKLYDREPKKDQHANHANMMLGILNSLKEEFEYMIEIGEVTDAVDYADEKGLKGELREHFFITVN